MVEGTEMYTRNFKLKVCKAKDANPDKTYKQIGTQYSVRESTVGDWYRRYQLYGDTAFDPDVPPFEDEEKLLELLKERDELLEERAILLAAMAFFEKKTRE